MKKSNSSKPQPTCFLLIGPPASGKSTWVANYLTETERVPHVASSDDVLEEIAVRESISYGEAHSLHFKEAEREYKARMIEAVRANRDIIVDRTNMRESARTRLRRMVESNTATRYRFVAIVFDIPIDVIRYRLVKRECATGKHVPWSIVEEMMATFDPPENEAYDLLTKYGI